MSRSHFIIVPCLVSVAIVTGFSAGQDEDDGKVEFKCPDHYPFMCTLSCKLREYVPSRVTRCYVHVSGECPVWCPARATRTNLLVGDGETPSKRTCLSHPAECPDWCFRSALLTPFIVGSDGEKAKATCSAHPLECPASCVSAKLTMFWPMADKDDDDPRPCGFHGSKCTDSCPLREFAIEDAYSFDNVDVEVCKQHVFRSQCTAWCTPPRNAAACSAHAHLIGGCPDDCFWKIAVSTTLVTTCSAHAHRIGGCPDDCFWKIASSMPVVPTCPTHLLAACPEACRWTDATNAYRWLDAEQKNAFPCVHKTSHAPAPQTSGQWLYDLEPSRPVGGTTEEETLFDALHRSGMEAFEQRQRERQRQAGLTRWQRRMEREAHIREVEDEISLLQGQIDSKRAEIGQLRTNGLRFGGD